MKYSLTIALIFVFGSQILAQNAPVMTFNDTMQYNFGDVNEGDKAVHIFNFTNTGNSDLVINEVKTTCFCTASEWPSEAIPPNGKGTIKVDFDTKGKNGEYAKGVNIYSNAGERNLIIYIHVLPSDNPSIPEPSEDAEDSHQHDHSDPNHHHDHK